MFKIILDVLRQDFKLKSIFFIIFLMITGSIFELFSIAAIIPLINSFSTENFRDIIFFDYINSIFVVNDKKELLSLIVKIILIFFTIRFFFLNFLTLKLNKFIATANKNIATNILKINLKKNYEWLTNENRSSIIHMIFTEVNNFCSNALYGFLFLLTEIFNLIGIITILALFNIKVFLTIVCICIVFFPIIFFITKKYSYTLGEKRQKLDLEMMKVLNENLKGIKEFLIYKRSNFLNEAFGKLKSKLVRIEFVHSSLQECTRYSIEFVGIAILIVIILITGSNSISSNQDTLLVLGVYAMAFVRVLPSFNRMTTYLSRFRYGLASGEKILSHYKNQSKDILDNLKDTPFENIIEIKDLFYKYKNQDNFLLENVNMTIKKNQTIGIIGESGSGKTTLTNIIMGLLKPQKGKIYIDDKDAILDNLTLQKKISFVSQEFFSLDETVFQNIIFGDEKVKLSNIRFALKNSLIYKAIKKKQLSLRVNIGDFGMKVSGGQLQRINIARALYRRPEILVLDEPTSALDRENKILLGEIIKQLKSKMTIIIISHQDDLIKDCDQVYKVVDKKVVKLNT